MAITKSNKPELSLDPNKPNEMSGCTLATLNALMRSLILRLSNLNNLTRLLLSLAHQWMFSAETMGKRPLMVEMDEYIYSPKQAIAVGGKTSLFMLHRTHCPRASDASDATSNVPTATVPISDQTCQSHIGRTGASDAPSTDASDAEKSLLELSV